MSAALQQTAKEIAAIGRQIHARGWAPATSGNFSARLGDGGIAVTVSGTDKGDLAESDVMPVNLNGQSTTGQRASAELELHLQLYRRDPGIGAVLHTHSVNATLVSQMMPYECRFEGLELLKAFNGVDTHESTLSLPVFDNSQNIAALAQQVEARMTASGQGHGYLIRGHGLYTWGTTLSECLRHLEALEFLLQYQILSQGAVKQ